MKRIQQCRERHSCYPAQSPKTTEAARGFAFILLAIILFVAAAIGITVLADYAIKDQTRKTDATLQADVYRAITGNPSTDQFGYLGDVGDYPAKLKDLLETPAGVNGWSGPYLPNALLSGSTVYDSYGSPLEYVLKLTAGSTDQLAIIGKGPDHYSSNNASDPNDWSLFTTPYPSTAGYSNTAGNSDNTVYPDFSASVNGLNYQNVGTLGYNIVSFDSNAPVNKLDAACPLLYRVVATSHTRGSSDTITIPYSPATTASNDPAQITSFLQGYWDVSITSPIIRDALFTEAVALHAGRTVTHTVRAPNIDSNGTPTMTLFVTNNSTATIQVKRFGTNVGSTITAGQQNVNLGTVKVCGYMTAVNTVGGAVLDKWVMPWGTNSTRVVGSSYSSLTITNNGGGGAANRRQLIVLRDGIPLGTVYRRKSVTFTNIPNGAAITVNDQANAFVASMSKGAGNESVAY